ncbi:MAG: copper chaperone PCu(A)C [Pseudomonadaceae bacterium]|nr:copper chaperone PCu(A)C [Pseudomonadaceae bacterium]
MKLLALLLCLAATAYALPPLPPTLTIYDATATPANKGGSSAVSMVIHNPQDSPATIIGATSPFARKVVLQHYVKQDGVTQLYPLKSLTVPAHADAAIVPFGLELRLMDVSQDLAYGMDVPLTLTFANGSQRTVRLTLESPTDDR